MLHRVEGVGPHDGYFPEDGLDFIEQPTGPVDAPKVGIIFELHEAIVKSLPIPGTRVILAQQYGRSAWAWTSQVFAALPNGERRMYFLKLLTRGERGRIMVHGEYESLKAIHAVSPELAPEPYAYGSFESGRLKTHFLLTQFRPIGQQPPAPVAFTKLLADLHRRSQSPTGRFGFHTTISHVTLPQITDVWEESWAVLYQRQFAHMVELDEERNGILTSFQRLARFTIDKVIPRLLEPLQSHGRSIKPCLVHGDLWDENTSTDISTGAPFIFDACSFYAHNELDLGNWRSLRHRLSRREYVESYKHFFPPSEPVQEWDDRNRLYSLRYELTYMIIMPGRYAGQRQCIEDSMLFLCQKYFPDEVLTAGLKDATSPELAECMKHP